LAGRIAITFNCTSPVAPAFTIIASSYDSASTVSFAAFPDYASAVSFSSFAIASAIAIISSGSISDIASSSVALACRIAITFNCTSPVAPAFIINATSYDSASTVSFAAFPDYASAVYFFSFALASAVATFSGSNSDIFT